MNPAAVWEATWRSPSVPSVWEIRHWWGYPHIPVTFPTLAASVGHPWAFQVAIDLHMLSLVHCVTSGLSTHSPSVALAVTSHDSDPVSSLVFPGRSKDALWSWWQYSDLEVNDGPHQHGLLTVLHLLRRGPSPQWEGGREGVTLRCPTQWYPRSARASPFHGDTNLRFRVEGKGETENPLRVVL